MSRNGRHLFTSESVTEGHPDKIADQISDSILDAILAQDPVGRVACETLVTTGLAIVAGKKAQRFLQTHLGRGWRNGVVRDLSRDHQIGQFRHVQVSLDVLQRHGARIDLPRSRSTPFIRLRGSAPRVQRCREGRPDLRHGLLGRGADLVSPDMGATVAR